MRPAEYRRNAGFQGATTMHQSRFLGSAAAAAIASALFTITPASAQDAGAADAAEDVGVGVIIVTPQRREEHLQEAPVSVGTLAGESLAVEIGREASRAK